MKHLVLLGTALLASQAWGQRPGDIANPQALCTPFVGYARDLLRVVDEQNAAPNEAARRAALATIQCAESAVRLWSRPSADAELSTIERRFETGTATSVELGDAQVAVAKATYCEALFSHARRMAEQYQRRMEVGLAGRADIATILARVETLIPVCGSSA